MSPGGEGYRAAVKNSEGKKEESSGPIRGDEPSTTREPKRRKLRRKGTRSAAERWEITRHDAWLRELLTDSSEDESEDKYKRFTGSEKWIAEMTGDRNRRFHEPEEDEAMGDKAEITPTSRGECSGPCEAGVAMSS
jgi:hypothetical protein